MQITAPASLLPAQRESVDAQSPPLVAMRIGSGPQEHEVLLDRLGSLRRVLPVLAQEMACARRQAAHLRIDNRRLTEQVRELRAALEARKQKPA